MFDDPNVRNIPNRQWMSKPSNDNSDLSCLKLLDTIIIKEVMSYMKALKGISTLSDYDITNERNEQLFYAFEEGDICQRIYCSQRRGFMLNIVNRENREIFRINRDFKCCSGICWLACCSMCSQQVTIESPVGTKIGSVEQNSSSWKVNYSVHDQNGTEMLTIVGPCCICDGPYGYCFQNKFLIYGNDQSTEIGFIQKQYGGYMKEQMSTVDSFTIKFPKDLDVKMKLGIISAAFLIDFMHFSSHSCTR